MYSILALFLLFTFTFLDISILYSRFLNEQNQNFVGRHQVSFINTYDPTLSNLIPNKELGVVMASMAISRNFKDPSRSRKAA